MNPAIESPDRSRLSIEWGVPVLCILVVFVPLFYILFPVLAFMSDPFGGSDEPSDIEPSEAFQYLTGWALPDGAAVLANRNTHSGLTNDGDYLLIVAMTPTQLQALVQSDSNAWHHCPVAADISQSAWDLPDHSGTTYYAKKTSDSDNDWHRGHVVIANPDKGMLWIYEWKS